MWSAIIFPYCIHRITLCQGVTEWAVLIGHFWLCTYSNHTQNGSHAQNGTVSKKALLQHACGVSLVLVMPAIPHLGHHVLRHQVHLR